VKNRILSVLTIVALLLTLVPFSAFADQSVTLNTISASAKTPGSEVTIAGTTSLTEVSIKVIRPNNTVLYVDVADVSNGSFTKTFKLASDAATGTYTVVAGQGNVVATTTFTVQTGQTGGGGEQPSNNANLSSLTISSGKLDPAFNSNTIRYKTTVSSTTGSVTVTPITAESHATVKVNGSIVNSGSASQAIILNEGRNDINILVTAQDGTTTKTYTITVIKLPEPTTVASGQTVSVSDTTTPIAVTVPAGVTEAKIKVTTQSTAQGKEATMPLVVVQAQTTLGTVAVEIPDGTTVTGPAGWDGTIKLPTVQANNSVSVSNGNVSAVVEVGLPDMELKFSHAVRLLIPGQAGKSAAFARGNGTPTVITRVLSADSQSVADSEIPDYGDAKINVESDLVIWTKHFTKFIAYTPISSSGGGGGGGSVSSNETTVSAKDGGKVTAAGVTIVIPANALASDIKVKVEKVTSTSGLPLPAKSKLISDVFEITKDKSGDFKRPVTITLTFEKSKVDADKYDVGIYWFNEETKTWVKLDNVTVDLAAGKVSGEVDHFTKFAVLATEKATEKPAETSTSTLRDITGHWAENTIKQMVERGIAKGYPDGTFKPNNNITRAEFAVMLVRAFNLAPQNGKVFADTADHWAKNDIATAAAYGIVNGFDANTFGPNNLITREQMAAMIVKAAKLTVVNDDTTFADSASISSWAKSSVATAVKNGIMKGYPDNTVKPKGNATRAEAVTVIFNALKL